MASPRGMVPSRFVADRTGSPPPVRWGRATSVQSPALRVRRVAQAVEASAMHDLRAETPDTFEDGRETWASPPSQLVVRWHRVPHNTCLITIDGEVDLSS